MYKKSILFLLLLCAPAFGAKETNSSAPKSGTKQQKPLSKKEDNASKKALIEKKIKEQIEREKKFAKEQKFYQGDAYNLKEHEVDPATLSDVPVIEPEDDFDITDVYRDDI